MSFLFLFLSLVLALARARAPGSGPLPPVSVELKRGFLLTWIPAEQQRHTVQSRGLGSQVWKDLSSCVRVSTNSCDVSAVLRPAEHGCASFRVRAEWRDGAVSEAVEACSRLPDPCTPLPRVSVRPGEVTVHLNRNHALALNYADHAQHRVCYGSREERLLKRCVTSPSSVVLPDLDRGQDYCVQVQFLVFSAPVGLPSCPECVQVPAPPSTASVIAPALVLSVLGLVSGSVLVYILVFHRERFKRWFRPEPVPKSLSLSGPQDVSLLPTRDETCETITDFRDQDQSLTLGPD